MASARVDLKMTSTLVVRESDGRALLLIAVMAGRTPLRLLVVDRPDD